VIGKKYLYIYKSNMIFFWILELKIMQVYILYMYFFAIFVHYYYIIICDHPKLTYIDNIIEIYYYLCSSSLLFMGHGKYFNTICKSFINLLIIYSKFMRLPCHCDINLLRVNFPKINIVFRCKHLFFKFLFGVDYIIQKCVQLLTY